MGTIKIGFGLVCLVVIGMYWGADGRVIKPVTKKENGYEKIIGIARKEIGVREEGAENSGARIGKYLDYVGVQQAAPWCAAFVSFVFKGAGYDRPRTAWSPALFPKNRLLKVGDAYYKGKGLVYGIYFQALQRIGHCGLVEEVRDSWITGIEGNTNTAGSREGDGVYRRIRHVRTVACFADWIR